LTFPTTIPNAHTDVSSIILNINNALRKSETKQKYASVNVLLLSWDVKEEEWVKEMGDLRQCFRGDFGFEVDEQKIPLDPDP
jgi:hypothetical protein